MKTHEVKTRAILILEQRSSSSRKYEQVDSYLQNTLKSSKYQENSISDIIGLSIPEEEEWEESKNYTITITKLEE